jgi:hypothetical protein
LEAYHLLGQHVNRQLLGGWDQEEWRSDELDYALKVMK